MEDSKSVVMLRQVMWLIVWQLMNRFIEYFTPKTLTLTIVVFNFERKTFHSRGNNNTPRKSIKNEF